VQPECFLPCPVGLKTQILKEERRRGPRLSSNNLTYASEVLNSAKHGDSGKNTNQAKTGTLGHQAEQSTIGPPPESLHRGRTGEAGNAPSRARSCESELGFCEADGPCDSQRDSTQVAEPRSWRQMRACFAAVETA